MTKKKKKKEERKDKKKKKIVIEGKEGFVSGQDRDCFFNSPACPSSTYSQEPAFFLFFFLIFFFN